MNTDINALRAENRKLSEKNTALSVQIEALEKALAAAATKITGLQAEIDRLQEEAAARETAQAEALAAMQVRIDEQTQRAADAVTVSELLHRALAADEAGDMNGLQKLLDRIEELKDLLSPTEADIYEELKIA